MSGKYTLDIRNGVLARYHGDADAIRIPNGVTKIDKAAFARASLREVFLPDGLSTIGERAFDSCENLRCVRFPESLTEISEGAFYGCRSLTDIRLPDGLRMLDRFAFLKCKSLVRVELPDNLPVIGDEAFGYCSALREIVLPRNLKTVGRYILGGCESLERITYPKNPHVMNDIFFTSKNNVCVIIPEGATELRYGILQRNESICEILLPKSLSFIEDHSFSKCKNLRSISFPNGRNENSKRLGGFRIYDCPALVLDDYIFGRKSYFFGPSFDDYDVAVLAGFLSQLCNNLKFNINSHKARLSRILRHADADTSKKGLGANTLGGLLRLAILKKRGLASVEGIDMVLESKIFSQDVEVIAVLLDCKKRLGGINTEPPTDDLLL